MILIANYIYWLCVPYMIISLSQVTRVKSLLTCLVYKRFCLSLCLWDIKGFVIVQCFYRFCFAMYYSGGLVVHPTDHHTIKVHSVRPPSIIGHQTGSLHVGSTDHGSPAHHPVITWSQTGAIRPQANSPAPVITGSQTRAIKKGDPVSQTTHILVLCSFIRLCIFLQWPE